jgi:hypothetical protein
VERLASGHEDVLWAVVVERFAGESAVESFQPQAAPRAVDVMGIDWQRRAGPDGGVPTTSQGHARTVFRRALERGNLLVADATARSTLRRRSS